MDFNTVISYINSSEFQENLFLLKVVFGFLSLFLLIAILSLLFRTQYLKMMFLQDWQEFFTHRPSGAKKMAKVWGKITKRLESAQESEYKLAVIEADEILDDTLKKMGFVGQTLGERIEKLTPEILPGLDQLKEARKVRDNILHDPDFRLNLEKTQKALDIYEQSFRDLEIL